MTPGEPARLSAKPLLCHNCLLAGRLHVAWTVGEGRALCVRCAVADQTDNDMDEHELTQELYEGLRQRGHPDAY